MSTAEQLLAEWYAGTATGGPEGDGRYPLLGQDGQTYLVYCPEAQALNPGAEEAQVIIYLGEAETHATNAQTAATDANAAKTAAQTSATNAAGSASAAASSQSAAQTSANNAGTSATNAAASATAAGNSQIAAANSATSASSSASAAAADATTATNQAAAASTSASAASTSATNAANNASAANTSATNAAGSASTASTKADEASTSATNAAGSASTATTQATNASNSASAASTSASNAASSASAASGSATTAISARDIAIAARDKANAWADSNENIAVETGKYSAKHWAAKAEAYAASTAGGVWGEITGTLSNQTDLVTALGGKANTAHTHVWGDITDKPTTFAPSAHGHAIADVTNLQTSLDGKANLASPTFTGNVGFGGQVGGAPVDVYVGTTGRVMIRYTSRNINGIESVNAANSAHAAFNIEASSFTFQGNTVWHGGNFDPATKANLASPTFTGGGNPSTPAGYAVTASGGYGGGYRMIDGAVQTSIWTQNDGSIRFGVGNSTSIAEVARFTTTNATFAGTVLAPMFEAQGSGKHFRVYDNNLTVPNLELGAGYNNATDRNAWIANRHADGFIELFAANGAHTFRVGTGGITYNTQQVWHAGNFTPANKLNYRASLEGYAETVTDWNNAVLNGWYMASGAANAPQTGGSWFMARVTQHNPLWIQQEAWVFTAGPSTTRWRRHLQNGTWSAWEANQQFNGVSVGAWPTSPTYRGMMAADGTYMIMTGNGADPTTYVGALGDVTIRPGNNNPNAQVRIANDAFSTIQPHVKLSNNGASWVRQPNIFLRSTDPGAEAAENDLWIW